ncbi:hypothetical protein [Frankia tisae]|uniref:hypothetical protein n=1 Tax=Frankia tisae TaxID=2950104 RepID=UPI0021BF3F1B|nr:hypothetical protein [Frankia tisae]
MDVDEDGVFEAGRAIRPYLGNLLNDTAAAAELDRHLVELLTGTAERSVRARRLRDLLDRHADTAWFLAQVLTDAPYYRPPDQQPGYRTRTGTTPGPLGDPGIVAAEGYRCPHGDYVWYRPDISIPVPACPTPGHGTLTRD